MFFFVWDFSIDSFRIFSGPEPPKHLVSGPTDLGAWNPHRHNRILLVMKMG